MFFGFLTEGQRGPARAGLALQMRRLVNAASYLRLSSGVASWSRTNRPTANLDSKNGHQVMKILRNIAKKENKTVVIVSHDQRILDIADRVIWLEDGKIKEGETGFVKDPVCTMKIEKEKAPFHIEQNKNTYYFCSKKCLDTFNERPEDFLKKEKNEPNN